MVEHINFLFIDHVAEMILSHSEMFADDERCIKGRVLFKLLGLYLYTEENASCPSVLTDFLILKTLQIDGYIDYYTLFAGLPEGHYLKKTHREVLDEFFSSDPDIRRIEIDKAIKTLVPKIRKGQAILSGNIFKIIEESQ